jgi:predicted nucleic acid binding AN1-type Zn finger protein
MKTPEEAFKEVFGPAPIVPKCNHKNRILKCRCCHGNFCAKCIQLEVHFCPKLDERSKIEKENLSKKLVKVTAPKVATF